MRKTKIKSEIWGVDKNWFFSGPHCFLHLSDIEAIHKSGDSGVAILLHGPVLNIDMKPQKERDRLYEAIKKCMMEYYEAKKKQQDTSQAMQRAQLEIQNRLAGHMTHNH